ncbi:MAG: DUF3168 domain-containing protein [Pseudomonadota bacterium]
MTYALSAALQTAVYTCLTDNVAVTDMVGVDIYDALPPGTVPETYVSLGPEEVTDASDKTAYGAQHSFTISVVTDNSGFQGAKDIAAAISDALLSRPLALSRGHVVGLWFERARAARTENGTTRRIDLTFRARVQDTL